MLMDRKLWTGGETLFYAMVAGWLVHYATKHPVKVEDCMYCTGPLAAVGILEQIYLRQRLDYPEGERYSFEEKRIGLW
jgi:hypothetical protein